MKNHVYHFERHLITYLAFKLIALEIINQKSILYNIRDKLKIQFENIFDNLKFGISVNL